MSFRKICEQAAYAGGRAIYKNEPQDASIKHDSPVGHHAIVSEADYISQKAILRELYQQDPEAFCFTEEVVKGESVLEGQIIINKENFDQTKSLLNSLRGYFIDEICGSSGFAIGHYDWCVSVGYVDRLEPIAGAVYAPKIDRGLLFSASKGEGAFLKQGDEGEKRIQVKNRELKDSYVIFGCDSSLPRYPKINKLMHKIADKARTTSSNGSCGLPLGLVAAGRADALIQPPQHPWDYMAGYLLVKEAGGDLFGFEMKKGKIIPFDKLQIEHYSPLEKKVGFVAGNKEIANQIMRMLLKI